MFLSDSCTYLRGRERGGVGVSALGSMYDPGRNKPSCFPRSPLSFRQKFSFVWGGNTPSLSSK